MRRNVCRRSECRRREGRILTLAACEMATVRENARRADERISRRAWLCGALLVACYVPVVVVLFLAFHPLLGGVLAACQAWRSKELVSSARAHRAAYGRWPWRGSP